MRKVLAGVGVVGAGAALVAWCERTPSWRKRDGLRRLDAVARVELTARELRSVIRACDLVIDVLKRDQYVGDTSSPLVAARGVFTAAAERADVDVVDPLMVALRGLA